MNARFTKYFSRLFTGCKPFVLSLLFVLLALSHAKAEMQWGVSITYRSLDSNRVEVTVLRYRACQAVPNRSDTIKVQVKGGATTLDMEVYRTAIADITPVCPGKSAPCSPANTTVAQFGIEQHTYKGIVDFSQAPYSGLSACNIYFIYENDFRSGAVTNISSTDIYVEAMMDRCKAKNNNAPSFILPPQVYTPQNGPLLRSHAAIDTVDAGDSISYKLVPARKFGGSNATYTTGFSATRPFSAYYIPSNPNLVNNYTKPPIGIYFNQRTGDLVATTTGTTGEVAVIAVEVTEWRKNASGQREIIGTMMRDMVFMTAVFTYTNPYISGTQSYTVAEGSALCFNINTQGANLNDTTEIGWSDNIPGATFTVVNPGAQAKTGRFCWTPPAGSARSQPYSFVVTATTDSCSFLNAYNSSTFSVKVGPLPRTTVSHQRLRCGVYAVNSTPQDTSYNYTYAWEAYDVNSQLINSGSGKQDTLYIPYHGLVMLKHIIYNMDENVSNMYIDTFTVDSCAMNRTLVKGRVFIDLDSNCVQDPGENGLYNQLIRFETPLYHYYINTDSLGRFNATLLHDTVVARLFPSPYLEQICPDSPQVFNLVLNNDTLPDSLIFGVRLKPGAYNAKVDITGNTGFSLRRGFQERYLVTVQNLGGLIMNDAKVSITLDSMLTGFYSTTSYLSKAGNVITWALPDIPTGAIHSFDFRATLPASAILGSTVTVEAALDSLTGVNDSDPDDNVAVLEQKVVAAIDPNDKQSNPPDYIKSTDKQIQYLIRFQNTGTAHATRVRVVDTIDTRLPLSAVYINATSHPYKLEIKGNVLTWIFDNINLPDSGSDEPGSHGFIRFTAKLIAGITDGMVIDNHADIYFDFEPAVRTNRVSVTKVTPLLALTSPVGGETLVEGYMHAITWQSAYVKEVKLDFSPDNGSNWQNIARHLQGASGTYNWNIPSVYTANGLIRVTDEFNPALSSTSAAKFAILDSVVPKLRLAYPIDTVTWYMDSTEKIRWTSVKVNEVFIELSTDSGHTWTLLQDHFPAAAGELTLQVPHIASTGCLARITSNTDSLLFSESPVYFTIKQYQGHTGIAPVLPGIQVLAVYPNPASQEVMLRNYTSQPMDIEVRDISGRQIAIFPVGANTVQSFNISHWSTGVYMLHTPAGQYKLVISR